MGDLNGKVPAELLTAVMAQSCPVPDEFSTQVRGYDFNSSPSVDYDSLLGHCLTTGFQSTSFGQAVEEVSRMLTLKTQGDPLSADDLERQKSNPVGREPTHCTIFLGYTSNLISAGTRETIRFLAQHNMVDVLVTTAGGVEEDFIKCMAPTFIGDFALPGKHLRSQGLNRIGNLIEPNANYCHFEDWLMPILDKMYEEEHKSGKAWTPSSFIHRLGKEIDNPDSVYYWAYKNNIPVFCPAITDGSIGDMLFMHTFKYDGKSITLDVVRDVRLINMMAMKSINTGMIILGGGVVKHHICNANLMRNGADFSVFVNVASEFDGSDSGARPDEAVSWGKIKASAKPVKVYGEASFIFPLLVAQTFAKFRQYFV